MQSELLKNFLAKTGQICSVTWKRDCKTLKNCPHKIEKMVSAVVRAGINYDKQAVVQEKRETGELPAENQGLPWGKWFVFPYVIEHKSEFYLRFYPFPGGKITRQFFMDGKPVEFQDVEAVLLASEKTESTGDCFNVRASSVLEMS